MSVYQPSFYNPHAYAAPAPFNAIASPSSLLLQSERKSFQPIVPPPPLLSTVSQIDGGEGRSSCHACTFENPVDAERCGVCKAPLKNSDSGIRRSSQTQFASDPHVVQSADSNEGNPAPSANACSVCSFHNSEDAKSCSMCQTPLKSEVQQDSYEMMVIPPRSSSSVILLQSESTPIATAQNSDNTTGTTSSSKVCSACTFQNNADAERCELCQNPLNTEVQRTQSMQPGLPPAFPRQAAAEQSAQQPGSTSMRQNSLQETAVKLQRPSIENVIVSQAPPSLPPPIQAMDLQQPDLDWAGKIAAPKQEIRFQYRPPQREKLDPSGPWLDDQYNCLRYTCCGVCVVCGFCCAEVCTPTCCNDCGSCAWGCCTVCGQCLYGLAHVIGFVVAGACLVVLGVLTCGAGCK